MAKKVPLSGPGTDIIGTGVAFIGNSLPRRCGIATFTSDLQKAVAGAGFRTSIAAMTDRDRAYEYPLEVGVEIREGRPEDYISAADFLNEGRFQVASLQHEFGIYGGEAGGNVVQLLEHLTIPIVTTLHTVLEKPSPAQRNVFDKVVALSAKVVVMAEKGRQMLRTVYGVPNDKIEVIPHGIPDFAFLEPDEAKARLSLTGRAVILTFGLLSPNKGIEVMIDAMPAILSRRPDAVYVVLGATHPNLVRDQGEAYRESLQERVRALGIADHVVFLDRFVDQATLLGFISMCDVYVTPYLNAAQMTSGTLAYSFGLGKAVVSTPYWHAQELLADGRGILVPFGDAAATGEAVAGLLCDDNARLEMRRKAYAESRGMIWARIAERYATVFESAIALHRPEPKLPASPVVSVRHREAGAPPEMRIDHFLSMCDDTGLLQHAVYCVPDRAHGYCVDDNARALLLACALGKPGEEPLAEPLTSRFAAFIQHAWNPATNRFRNFMSFDRHWLEESGSEDSHGRTLWALGECTLSGTSLSLRRWAGDLFIRALAPVSTFHSPRAWAFTLLGLNAYCSAKHQDETAQATRKVLSRRLLEMLVAVESKNWVWFETGLAYDNARLPQALIATGDAIGSPDLVEAGLRTLRWLTSLQVTPDGWFRPFGTDGFGQAGGLPEAFDQQPLEASATISACIAAWHATCDGQWRTEAEHAFAWFTGRNDLLTPVADVETGSCRDGLHRDRANENRGGESVLSYLLGLSEIRQLPRKDAERRPAALPAGNFSPLRSGATPRTRIVDSDLPQSPSPLPAAGSGKSGRATVQTGDRATRFQPH